MKIIDHFNENIRYFLTTQQVVDDNNSGTKAEPCVTSIEFLN